MSESKKRRQWTAARKLQIVLETLGSDRTLAEVCRREAVSPNLVHKWRKQLLGSAEAIFARHIIVSTDTNPFRSDPECLRRGIQIIRRSLGGKCFSAKNLSCQRSPSCA